MKPAVLMGEPTYFRIVGGANPFTRDLLGRRKKVDRNKAIEQWHQLAQMLTQLGVEVYVIPPHEEAPGLVYPANAGFVADDGTFVLSNLIEARKPEEPHYKHFLEQLGLKTASISKRFEGEADFFPFQDKMIFTFGQLEKQRFVVRWGLPPWKRIYGFRSDQTVQSELATWVKNKKFLPLRLIHESYYHGDTALCSFGANRETLLVYLDALSPESRASLQQNHKKYVIELSADDAAIYAANSFFVTVHSKKVLVMPQGVSAALIQRIEKMGIEVVCVDVSEFWKKGGGSVKCMIGNLGELPKPKEKQVELFRKEHLYKSD